MKTLAWILLGILCGLLAAGLILVVSSPPRGQAIALLPPPTPAPLLVHVAGAVARPGLYPLPQGSRVNDALLAAGGLQANADSRAINLAAPLEDGKRLEIPTLPPTPAPIATPRPGSPTARPPDPTTPPQAAAAPTATAQGGLININTASLEELDSLPGIGPAIAQRIMDYRTANGAFRSIEEIQNVSGIGPSTFEKIKDLITVGDTT